MKKREKPRFSDGEVGIKEVADEMAVTRQRVQQIQNTALEKLRKALARKKIRKLDDIL